MVWRSAQDLAQQRSQLHDGPQLEGWWTIDPRPESTSIATPTVATPI
jgi:hypothetical protein